MLKKGIEYYHEEVEVYPIWLCPAKAMDVGKNFRKNLSFHSIIQISLMAKYISILQTNEKERQSEVTYEGTQLDNHL